MQEEKIYAGSIRQLEDHGYIWMDSNLRMSEVTGLIHQVETVADLVALVAIATFRIEDMATMEMEVVA